MAAHDAGALPWLRKAQIVNSSSRYSFTPYPENKLQDYLADVTAVDGPTWVLNHLQRSRSTPLDARVLRVLLTALLDAMPDLVRIRVGLDMANKRSEAEGEDGNDEEDNGSVIGQPDWFAQGEATFKATAGDFDDGTRPPLNSNNKEYILWVVNTSRVRGKQHYVTVVLHYKASNPEEPTVHDRISHWAIVDASPQSSYPARSSPADRLRRLLHKDGIEEASAQTIWVPPQENLEPYTSGLLAYSVVSQLLDRIALIDSRGGGFLPYVFFAPMRPFFNPDAVRAEAFGHAAFHAMGAMKFKTRLAMFPIDKLITSDGEGGKETTVAPESLSPSAPLTETFKLPLVSFPLAMREGQTKLLADGVQLDLRVAFDQVTSAAEHARKTEEFAEKIQHEVLEAPGDASAPALWALERLRGMNHLGEQQIKSAAVLIESLGRKAKMETVGREETIRVAKMKKDLEDMLKNARISLDGAIDVFIKGVARRPASDQAAFESVADNAFGAVDDAAAAAATTEANGDTTGDGEKGGDDEVLDWLEEVFVKGKRSSSQKRKRKPNYRTTTDMNENGETFDTLHIRKRRKYSSD